MTTARVTLVLAAVLGIIHGAAPARAASFDCSKARLPDELAICRNQVLSEMDTEMGALWFSYSKVPMLMGSNGARHDDAQRFLIKRAGCKANAVCLAGAYRARNSELRRNIVEAMARISAEENR